MSVTLRRVIIVTIIAGVIIVYALFNPADSGLFPQCVFHRVTGLQCPGCGAQRMLHALLHGDIAGAFRYNALLFLMLPLLAFMAWLDIRRKCYPGLYARFYSTPLIITIGVALCAWLLIRNLLGL